MKLLSTLGLSILFAFEFTSMAQNYRPINPNRTQYFKTQNQIRALVVDTVFMDNTDTIYRFFENIQKDSSGCYHPDDPSWMGREMRITPDSSYIFTNKKNNQILLKPLAGLHEEWVFYEEPNFIVTAKVEAIVQTSVLNTPDSVKTIRLTISDSLNNPVNHDFNSCILKISKQYGLYQTIAMFYFPEKEPSDFLIIYQKEYILKGVNNPKQGITNITNKEVYDFYPGDELHVIAYFYSDPWGASFNADTSFLIYQCTSRQEINDELCYTFFIKNLHSYYSSTTPGNNWQYYTYNEYSDTVCYGNDSAFDAEPWTPVIYNNKLMQLFLEEGIAITKVVSFKTFSSIPSNPNCWNLNSLGFFNYHSRYYAGLGGPYYTTGNIGSYNYKGRILKYYKKGGIGYGTPLSFNVNIPDSAHPDSVIRIFPNPVTDNLVIDVQNNLQNPVFYLYNQLGQIVKIHALNNMTINTIARNELVSGMYFYEIRDDFRLLKSGKIIYK